MYMGALGAGRIFNTVAGTPGEGVDMLLRWPPRSTEKAKGNMMSCINAK